jgi:hypothetical protein
MQGRCEAVESDHYEGREILCWLIRRDVLDRVDGWRMSQEERAEPSQALLFRL